jgi:hypothetical protein
MSFILRSPRYAGIPIASGDISNDVTEGQVVNVNGVVAIVAGSLKKNQTGNFIDSTGQTAFGLTSADLIEGPSVSKTFSKGSPVYFDPNTATTVTTTKGNGTLMGYAYLPVASTDTSVMIAGFNGYKSGEFHNVSGEAIV